MIPASGRSRDPRFVPLVDDVRRLIGLFACLATAVLWACLAAWRPGSTWPVAPMIVAAAWVAVDGSIGAGLTQRRSVNEALGGLAIAVTTAVILMAKGDLAGSTFWDETATTPALIEHVVLAVVGAALGGFYAVRLASRPPRTT